MFENYPGYVKDVIRAAKGMSPAKKARTGKCVAASTVSVVIAASIMGAGTTAIAHAQVRQALESVSGEIANQTVQVEVDDSNDNSIAYLLSDNQSNLSATDEASISEQIKTSITQDALAKAVGNIDKDGNIQADILTADGIPVTVTIKKVDGSYTIEKITAKIDSDIADEKKKQVTNAISTDAQKQANAIDLGSFTDGFSAVSGLAQDADDDTRAAIYDKQMVVLADGLVMGLPSGYETQEVETDQAAQAEQTAVDQVVDAAAKPEEKLTADSVKPYALSYKSSDGSSVSVRAENLGVAFTMMNGPDGANKMMGYWQETANNVAAGAEQHLKNEEEGFQTQLFYDAESGMWGYFGHVEFTDGIRDVVYNRVVFVDELADQMITVSYRHDSAADTGTSMAFDAFKKMFMHAPKSALVDPIAGADPQDPAVPAADDQTAIDAYVRKLRDIQILPGQTMTEPEREAEEAHKVEETAAAADEPEGQEEGEQESSPEQ